MWTKYVITITLLALCVASVRATNEDQEEQGGARKRRGFGGVFNIVKFANEACHGSGSKNGTCYTAAECDSNGGIGAGECAAGYGVCCIFTRGCGSKISQNCTYFEQNTDASGPCEMEICKCTSHVCQLRLDFNTFVITGPSTDTLSTVTTFDAGLTGDIAGTATAYTDETRCLTDTFSVTNPGGAAPPTICGRNSGEHMYVDASDQCNMLSFLFGTDARGTAIANRAFNIKVTQFNCDYENLAPTGCTQWFFNNDATGLIKTFNFDGGLHLASQNQNICIRRENNNCRICYSAQEANDVNVSGDDAASATELIHSTSIGCCGNLGSGTTKIDCFIIPGAETAMGGNALLTSSAFCGRGEGLRTAALPTSDPLTTTICTRRQPFHIRFLSDRHEFFGTESGDIPDKGLKLFYSQNGQDC